MEILLVSHQPNNRITWQSRILIYSEVVNFNLRMISDLDQNSSMATVVILILDTDDLSSSSDVTHMIQQARSHGEHAVFVLLEEFCCDPLQVAKHLDSHKCHYIRERDFDSSDFYQMLFKPRRNPTQPSESTYSSAGAENDIEKTLEDREIPGKKELEKDHQWMKPLKKSWINKKRLQRRGSDPSGSQKTLPRLKLCVFGATSVIYELAAVLASYYNQQVLLMDLDRLSPSADVFTGVNVTVKIQYDFFSKASATGVNILFDCLKKGDLQREAFVKASQRVKGIEGLSILTGAYQLSDFEYYRSEDLVKLVDRAAGYYDVVLMRTNGFPYDGFTLKAFAMADYIIGALRMDIQEVRAYRQLVELLSEKQKIKLDKHLWLSYESKPIDPFDKHFFESLAGTPWIGSADKIESRDQCTRTGKGYLKNELKLLISMYSPLIDEMYRSVITHEPSA